MITSKLNRFLVKVEFPSVVTVLDPQYLLLRKLCLMRCFKMFARERLRNSRKCRGILGDLLFERHLHPIRVSRFIALYFLVSFINP